MDDTRAQGPHRRIPGRAVVGAFFLWTSGVHLGIVAADPRLYRHFADAGLFPFVRSGWDTIVMRDPVVWGLLLMVGEAALGALLLVGGRAAGWGWYGVIAFHLLLMLFGVGFWLWCLPALGVLFVLARRDLVGRADQLPADAASPGRRPAAAAQVPVPGDLRPSTRHAIGLETGARKTSRGGPRC